MSSETSKEVTVNKWDVGALKIALDDAAKEVTQVLSNIS